MFSNEKINLTDPKYTPNRLLNRAMEFLGVETDSQLSSALEFDQAIISRTRKHKSAISYGLMVSIMDRTNWPIAKVRELAGMPFDGPSSEGAFKPIPKPPKRIPGPPVNKPKITDTQVLEIRMAKGPAKITAKRYGITVRYVNQIRTGTCRRVARLVQSCCAK